jgi:hypothetical protein
MPHFGGKSELFRVSDGKVIVVATHREVPTTKSLRGC